MFVGCVLLVRLAQVLRDFVRVLNPNNAHSSMNGWNRRWLLRLNGQESQKKQPAVCNIQNGEARYALNIHQ